MAGLKNSGFAYKERTPYKLNQMCYQAMLIKNDARRFRGLCDDVDYSIQVLYGGECTVLFSVFAVEKSCGKTAGGCHDTIYAENGREKRAKQLQELWPNLDIRITERWGRTHLDASRVWRQFQQRLIAK